MSTKECLAKVRAYCLDPEGLESGIHQSLMRMESKCLYNVSQSFKHSNITDYFI